MAEHGRRRLRLVTMAWGARYIDELFGVALPAVLAPNNLPYLAARFDCEVVIITEEARFDDLRARPVYRRLANTCRVELRPIDDLVTRPDAYGMALTYALFRGFEELGPAMLDTYLVFFNSDFILADGSLRSVAARIAEGERLILAPSYCVVYEEVEPLLRARLEADGTVLAIPPREMAAIAIGHRHNTIRGKTVNQPQFSMEWIDQFYWVVDGSTILAHQLPIALVCMRPERVLSEMVTFWDYGILSEACPTARRSVIADSDDFLMIELRQADTAQQQIRPGWPTPAQIAEKLERFITKDPVELARFTLVLHAGELPSGVETAKRQLDAYVESVLKELPAAPRDHVNHYIWAYHYPTFHKLRRQYLIRRGRLQPGPDDFAPEEEAAAPPSPAMPDASPQPEPAPREATAAPDAVPAAAPAAQASAATPDAWESRLRDYLLPVINRIAPPHSRRRAALGRCRRVVTWPFRRPLGRPALRQRLRQLEVQLAAHEIELARRQADCEASAARLGELQAGREAAAAEQARALSERDNAASAVARLRADCDAAASELSQLRNRRQGVAEEVAALEARRDTEKAQAARLWSEAESAAGALSRAYAEHLARLSRQAEEGAAENARLVTHDVAMMQRLQELERHNAALTQAATELAAKLQANQARDYQLLMAHQQLLAEMTDADPAFFPLYERCRSYTMTSVERLYALYQATRYVVSSGIEGDVVETGVWKGGSCMLVAETLLGLGDCRRILLFDTFAGHPRPDAERDVDLWGNRAIADWERQRIDEQSSEWASVSLEQVRGNLGRTGYPAERLVFVKGMVEETLAHNLPERVALLRLDTDWYESTRVALAQLYPRLSPGGLLIVDDYGHYRGQRQAVDEYFDATGDRPLLHRIDYSCRVAVKLR
jgi:hypothetical protein